MSAYLPPALQVNLNWDNMPSIMSMDVENSDNWFIMVNVSKNSQIEAIEGLLD